MKRIFMWVAFLAILVVASGCTNPFNKKEDAVTDGQQNFTFEVAQSIRAELQDKFLATVDRRLTAYNSNYELIANEFTEDNKFILKFKAPVEETFEVDKFTNYMANTPTFEIRLKEKDENLVLTDTEKKAIEEYNAKALAIAKGLLNQVVENPDSFAEVAKQYSEDPGSKDNGGAYTGIKKGQFVPEYDAVIFGDLAVGAIYPEIVESSFGYHIIKKDNETGAGDERLIDTSHILIMKKSEKDILASKQWLETDLVGMDIESAEAFKPTEETYAVGISLNETGTEALKKFTEENMDRQMAIFVDGVGIAAPVIEQVIANGKIIITGDFTETGANNLAQRLNDGVLNMPIRVVQE